MSQKQIKPDDSFFEGNDPIMGILKKEYTPNVKFYTKNGAYVIKFSYKGCAGLLISLKDVPIAFDPYKKITEKKSGQFIESKFDSITISVDQDKPINATSAYLYCIYEIALQELEKFFVGKSMTETEIGILERAANIGKVCDEKTTLYKIISFEPKTIQKSSMAKFITRNKITKKLDVIKPSVNPSTGKEKPNRFIGKLSIPLKWLTKENNNSKSEPYTKLDPTGDKIYFYNMAKIDKKTAKVALGFREFYLMEHSIIKEYKRIKSEPSKNITETDNKKLVELEKSIDQIENIGLCSTNINTFIGAGTKLNVLLFEIREVSLIPLGYIIMKGEVKYIYYTKQITTISDPMDEELGSEPNPDAPKEYDEPSL
jgi:hypothetical protein